MSNIKVQIPNEIQSSNDKYLTQELRHLEFALIWHFFGI
jgi:hypothetical protein